jgi:threonine/homoserine/homoserine lactone efflux protein
MWLGVETLRSSRTATLHGDVDTQGEPRQELWRGAMVNALNPHPYLFWATVGGPTLVNGWRASPWHALAFLLSFYLLLVGSKVLVAWLVSSQSARLSVTWYRRLLMGCGLAMLAMGGLLIYQMWAG